MEFSLVLSQRPPQGDEGNPQKFDWISRGYPGRITPQRNIV